MALAVGLVFPHLPFVPYSLLGVALQAGQIAIVAAALVMLTGWVGQISLGHSALVGVGAYATGWATAAWHLPFPFSTAVGGALAAVVAGGLGMVALRVRGLYLAVATLIFSWMADAFLFRIPTVVKHNLIDVPIIGHREGVPRFDLNNRTTMYYITWGIAVGVLFLVANLRDSRTGRAFYAVRGSEIGASSLGIDVTRYKLLAFTVSGLLAGISGNLVMLDSRSLSPDQFQFTSSLFFLAVVVVGGLGSLAGGVASSIMFASLNEVFFRVRALGDALDLVSAVLLAGVLLAYPGGLAALPAGLARLSHRMGDRWVAMEPEGFGTGRRRAVKSAVAFLRRGTDAAAGSGRRVADGLAALFRRPALTVAVAGAPGGIIVDDAPATAPSPGRRARNERAEAATTLPSDRGEREVLIRAEHVTVQFGGLTAVRDASLSVCRGEIVGLIGPNGAGKTTLFNAIAGLNRPASGTVELLGDDATQLPVHRRAAQGVARTFQAIQLFPQLDVFDNLLVATHVHQNVGFLRNAFVAERSIEAEKKARATVAEVIDEVGLGHVAHRRVTDLPFGVLRMVEVARAVVTGFPVIMLDEPASGLDNSETDRLSSMLLEIRGRGSTLLLIEHDVRMVTGVSDYMYVLSRGEIIAEGVPADVQRDPAVIGAYLGEATTNSRTESSVEA